MTDSFQEKRRAGDTLKQLRKVFELQEGLASAKQELKAIELEWEHFKQDNQIDEDAFSPKRAAKSQRIMKLWLRYQAYAEGDAITYGTFGKLVERIKWAWMNFTRKYLFFFFLPLDKIKGVQLHPRNYCCWKNETNWDVGFFTRQKTYIEHVTHEDGEPIETPHYIVTCAGANKTVKQLFIHSVEQDYDTENNPENYTPEELEFIREPRSISDFVPGIMIPGKLSQKRIKGGDRIMRKTVSEQAEEILQKAEAFGVDKNFFFITTFRRYMVQLKILSELESSIKNDGVLVTKEYVKGRKNVYSHPAIQDFNRTTDSANKTVSTLMKIISKFSSDDNSDSDTDPLLQLINGGDDDGSYEQ